MNTQTLIDTTTHSFQGTRSFPDIVKTLIAEGVESYHVDLVQNHKTFYMPDGRTFTESFDFSGPRAAADFDQAGVVAALRATQARQINYPQFLTRILEAGSTGYTVYLTGRKAVYFGRKGEFYVENFPQ